MKKYRYRVVDFVDPLHVYPSNEAKAMKLLEEYGLWHLTVDQVRVRWEQAGSGIWNKPDKIGVEKVFGVKLEEV